MNDIGWLLVLILTLLILIRRTVLKLGGNRVSWFMDPVALFCGAWLIEAVAYSLPILVNRHPLEIRHVLYIALCHGCFVVGVMMVSPKLAKRANDIGDATAGGGVSIPLLLGIAALGFLGNFSITYDGLSTSSVSLMDRLTGDSMSAIRGETVAVAATLQGGKLAMFESFGSASTIFVFMVSAGLVAAMPNVSPRTSRWIYILAFVSMLLVAFNSLVIHGARGFLMHMLVGIWLAALMDPKRWLFTQIKLKLGAAKWPAAILATCLVLSSVWYFATDFMKDRTGTTSPLSAMAAFHRTVATPEVESLVGNNEELQYGLLSFSYLTVPLSTLGYYYDLGDSQFPGPYWGQYNFSGVVTFVMRRMGYLKYQRTMTEIREQATASLVRMGYGDNVWSTLIRDLALDVGWSGVPLVMFILGFGSELVMRAARQDGNFLMKIVALMTAILLLFSIAHSLLILESFQKVYWICFLLLGFQKVFGAGGVFSLRHRPLKREVGHVRGA